MTTLRTLIDRALVLADEVATLTTNSFDNELRIASFAEAAVRWVLLNAPVRLLTPTPLYGYPECTQHGSGYIELPTDYLRLCTLRMEGWRTEVYEVLPAHHPLAALQLCPATRALPAAPLCFYATTPTGVAAIRYYGVPKGEHEIAFAAYQAEVTIDTTATDAMSSEITINSQLLDAIAYKCVAAYFASLERIDLMQVCEAQAAAAIPAI